MANFCQHVLKPLGSYRRVFTVVDFYAAVINVCHATLLPGKKRCVTTTKNSLVEHYVMRWSVTDWSKFKQKQYNYKSKNTFLPADVSTG